MSCLQIDQSVLLVVDMQASLMPAIAEQRQRIDCAKRLIAAAKELQVPVFATEHVPHKIGHTVPGLAISREHVLTKTHFDATREPDFAHRLPQGKNQVVLFGAEAHICVLQTALGLIDGGYQVWLVADACGSRDESDRRLAFERLARAGGTIISSEMAIFEWLAHANHPKFRQILTIVKSRD